MLALLLLACQTPSDDTGEPPDALDACHDDLPVGESAVVASGLTGGTEGITVVDGRLFATDDFGVVELTGGGVTRLAEIEGLLGLAPGLDGVLAADAGDFTLDGSGDDGRLLHVGFDGVVTVLAEGMPNPNFVTQLRGGPVLVSDDTAAIYAVADGAYTVWSTGVPSPNGMAFADPGPVYVVSTFVSDPPLWRVDATNFAAGEPEIITQFETGSTPDGVALDAEGQVWVALNLAGQIVRVNPDTGEITARYDGLSNPASITFGDGALGEGLDPCSLYMTQLYGEEVVRLSVGVPGQQPAPYWEE
jgi:hypothetical protein